MEKNTGQVIAATRIESWLDKFIRFIIKFRVQNITAAAAAFVCAFRLIQIALDWIYTWNLI